MYQCAQPVITGQPETRHAPARKISKPDFPALRNNSRKRRSARIRRADDASNAATRNARNWDGLFFEYAQHTKMGVASREAATERQAYSLMQALAIKRMYWYAVQCHEEKDRNSLCSNAMGQAFRCVSTKVPAAKSS